MRKVINSTFITLDGAVERPHQWPSLGDAGADTSDEISTKLLYDCDGLLMGRLTYESFAAVWPTRSGDKFSDRINTMQKYVVSITLLDPAWENTTVISRDVVGAIQSLKLQEGMSILQYGL